MLRFAQYEVCAIKLTSPSVCRTSKSAGAWKQA
jgi:hypothetical protein